MPARFAAVGDRHAAIDDRPCSLERAARAVGARTSAKASATRRGRRTTASRPASRRASQPSRAQTRSRRVTEVDRSGRTAPAGRRTSTQPLIEIGRARAKDDALAGLERWKARHPEAAAHLEPADVLVDAMRGRFQTWTRIRVNLQHVPEALRPPQEAARSRTRIR